MQQTAKTQREFNSRTGYAKDFRLDSANIVTKFTVTFTEAWQSPYFLTVLTKNIPDHQACHASILVKELCQAFSSLLFSARAAEIMG